MEKDWLVELMGEEYAQSDQGKFFYALEGLYLKNSRGKFRDLCAYIGNLIKEIAEVKGSIPTGSHCFNFNTYPEKLQWKAISQATVYRVQAMLAYYDNQNDFQICKLWRKDPLFFLQNFSDTWKLIKSKYPGKA